MTVTYSTLVSRVYRLLGDSNQNQFADDLIYDGILGSHQAILPWVPKFAVVTLSSGSSLSNLTLPSDCYQVDTLQEVDTGKFIPKSTLAPQTYRNVGDYADYDWVIYPSGYLNMSRELDEGEEFKLYYRAFWSMPTSESDLTFVIEVPQHAHAGMLYWAVSHVLLSKAQQASNLGQFRTRVDSGTPEDNPWDLLSDVFLKRFYQEMKLMPPYTKVSQ